MQAYPLTLRRASLFRWLPPRSHAPSLRFLPPPVCLCILSLSLHTRTRTHSHALMARHNYTSPAYKQTHMRGLGRGVEAGAGGRAANLISKSGDDAEDDVGQNRERRGGCCEN